MQKLLYILLLTTGALWGLGGCTKFSDSLTKNPNQPDTFSNPKLLTYAIQQMVRTTENTNPSDPLSGANAAYGLLYIQHLSEKIYTDASRYVNINFEFAAYYTPLMNLNLILNTQRFNEDEGSANNQKAAARILRAFYFWHITDRWGDVPYSEALQGKEKIAPKYDSQKDIYTDLFKELKEAGAQVDDGNAVEGDILYYGDMEKWKRLAGTLRALMALRLSKVDPAWGRREFAAAVNDGTFTSNDDNALFRHLKNSDYQNYWYFVWSVQGRRWYCPSKTLVDYMRPLNDPRLPVYAATNGDGEYVGMPYGLPGGEAQNIPASEVSFMNAGIRAQDATSYFITYAQLLLAKAEAAKLGWIPGGDAEAEKYYKDAIEASVAQWTGSVPADIDVFTGQPGVKYTPADALRQIAYQRWVHLYMNGYEAWAEWRRTGYPLLQPAPNNNNIPIPRRQGYPLSEQNINTANWKAAVQAQPGFNGKDDLTGRVWWDK